MAPSDFEKRAPAYSSVLYALIVSAFCIWILSLPLFPSQDGPIHRYYIHVLDSLLHHQTTYQMYTIRHPFPPYATHYTVMLLLSKVFAYDWAEKVFVCIALVCFAYGLRMCAKVAGPAGEWVSLFAAPLFLPWALMMGFFNSYLATGLFLFAASLWQLASRGRPRLWAAFAAVVLLLTFTHPVPLLLLLAVCGLDLAIGSFRLREFSTRAWLHANTWRSAALLFVFGAFLFPASLVDKQHAHSMFEGFGLHPHFISSMALLMGMSPYNTRSTSLWINVYRLSLYLLIVFSLMAAFQGFRRVLRERDFGLSSTFLAATLLLGVALFFIPNSINGTVYFATRLTAMLWVGALLASSAYSGTFAQRRPLAIALTAVAFTVATLVPAEIFLRPVARDLRAGELQPLPQGKQGVLLIGYGLQDYVRFHGQLAFNPYQWGTALAPVRHEDVVLDSPWMDQNIAPIAAVPGGPLTADEITDRPFDQKDPPKMYGRSLSKAKEGSTVNASSYVLYAGTPEELARGLKDQFDPDEAARFKCVEHGWYLVCLPSAKL